MANGQGIGGRFSHPIVTGNVTHFANGAIPPGSARVGRGDASKFVVIASRIASPDRLDVVLRGEFDGCLCGAMRHAATVAAAVAHRFGVQSCADVTDAATGLPLFSVTAGGVA